MKQSIHICSVFLLSFYLATGCCSDRKLVEFEKLDHSLSNPELNSEITANTAPKPKLPTMWRGRKLFSSPWAYIYAQNKEAAEYVYDELEEIASSEDKQNSYGLVIVTGAKDKETAFDYKSFISLYEKYINKEDLLEEEKVIFQTDLDGLNKIKKFHVDMYEKADEKKDENELHEFRESIDHIITFATYFIQPEILEQYMETPIDESVYWTAFISVDDSIDENLDAIITAIMEDYDVSTVGRGLVWGFISPGLYFKKRKVIKETQKHFADGYKKNALLNNGTVQFSDRAINSQEPAGVKASE